MISDATAVFIETFGCQMNVLDSELVQDQLETLGYAFVSSPERARVVLINTCSVRDLSEQKVWSLLGRLGIAKRAQHRDLVIGVLGCMAEREAEALRRRMPHVDFLCGPSSLGRLPVLLENALSNRGLRRWQAALAGHPQRHSKGGDIAGDDLESFDQVRNYQRRHHSNQAYVRITRGCDKLCSFCVVPFARGPEAHRDPREILREVKRLVEAGAVEVTLLGQTVNHYRHTDGGRTTTFAELLHRVHEEVPELARLRFLTSYPRDFTDEVLEVMAAAPRICRYLHLPAQTGSDRMLRAMNRGHTSAQYLELLARARRRLPDIRIAGDMIVGFPGETEQDQQASIELLRAAQYKSCFVFKYSPRPGTQAYRRLADDVPEEVKKARNNELLAVQAEITEELFAGQIGRSLEVLVEGLGKLRQDKDTEQAGGNGRVRLLARTRGDEIVAFDGPRDLIGTITRVTATRATGLTLFAELAEGD